MTTLKDWTVRHPTEDRYAVLIWCLPGMPKARIVMEDEDGVMRIRMMDRKELEELQGGITEALRRVT